eukprot:TRINITY_DN15391_c0_g1_i3.p1 TRINITY_DN15391_c0_g1~~TRINITY_DN15391_c0_g1_i3.p1  ORF type:complete len:361 (+),score=65.25 TRINITY_DN15391_c0_g1_i3:191-1273(+)
MLADHMLTRIEYVHSKNYIHRDIKPDNFLIGQGKKMNTVYIIDFGLSKKYRDPKSQKHVPYRENRSLTGTARYASINAHRGVEQGRRDDLEAIGYVLMYFLRGSLPWQGFQAKNKDERYRKILECKMATTVESLTHGYPPVFASYLNYCRGMGFEDQPDYESLRTLFRDFFVQEGMVNDGLFDWSHILQAQRGEGSSKDNTQGSASPGGAASGPTPPGLGQALASAEPGPAPGRSAAAIARTRSSGDSVAVARGESSIGRGTLCSSERKATQGSMRSGSVVARSGTAKEQLAARGGSGAISLEGPSGRSVESNGTTRASKNGKGETARDEAPRRSNFLASLFGCGTKARVVRERSGAAAT